MTATNTKNFATAINCMDGRVQLPVIEFMQSRYGVDYVDMITEAGPIGILSKNRDADKIDSMKKRAEISLFKHNSGLIALVGHFDCAGNPVDKEEQIKQIRHSAAAVRSWNFNVEVIGLWVDDNWTVHEVNLKDPTDFF